MERLINTSVICLIFISLSASRSSFISFLLRSILTGEFLKSNRLVISFFVTLTALSRTCGSTLLTISKDGIIWSCEANVIKSPIRRWGFLLIITACLHAAFFFTGATIMSSTFHAFKGFAKIIGKSHCYLAAIPVVAEGRFRLLEVDISFGFVGIEDIADGQF